MIVVYFSHNLFSTCFLGCQIKRDNSCSKHLNDLNYLLIPGRYPIHFHLSGNVTGSYVRGCAIHHTFNRAVTVHGVSGLLVEHNVANDIMGHAFFIEDGIETGNTIQYNLGVAVRTSSTLLTTDVTPATFWVTNPNNTSK